MFTRPFSRRTFCAVAGGLVLAPVAAVAGEPPSDVTFVEDFDELWRTLGERYCFFADKRTDWNRVRTLYRPMAEAAQTGDQFTEVARRVLAELYDAHTHLSSPPDGSPRWPLYDLFVERAGGRVRIAAIEEGSAAADAGLSLGDAIVGIGGVAIDTVAAGLAPQCLTRPDPVADAYVLNVAVAGCRGQGRSLTVQTRTGVERVIALPVKKWPDLPDLDFRTLEGELGYIRIRSFGDRAVATAFDAALASLRAAPGLIIDVRDNGGGDTAVARPIMGRFIGERRPYARMRRREGQGLSAPWTEWVEPRGPFTYTGPVVVLTDRWSASMAEGFPMGMRDIGRARIVGAPMMGLGAAVFTLRLDRTGLQAQYSGEPVYDTRDMPRSQLRPDVEVSAGGDILAAGVRELTRLVVGLA